MKHQIQINVSQAPKDNRIVQCRNVNIRERLLTRLFGKREKVMILVPGNSVESVGIIEVPEGGEPGG